MADEKESTEALLKRIDERTTIMLDSFNRHAEQTRQEFKEVHAGLAAVPERATQAARAALVTIGFDLTEPTSHQKDAAFVREVRGMAEKGKFFEPLRAAAEWSDTQDTVKKAGLRAAAGLMVLSLIGLLWEGFAEKVRAIFQ